MTTLGRVATRGAGVTLIAQAGRFCLQIASLAVLTRLLTPHDFGLVAMVTATLGVAEILRDFGLSSAAIQAPELSVAQRTNLFWVNTGIGTACAIVGAALGPLLARIYHEPELTGIAFVLAGLFVVSGANTQYRADMSRSMRFGALALTDVIAAALSIALAVVAALLGAGYWAVVLQQVVFVVTTFVLNLLQCRWIPGRPRRDTSVRALVRFGSHLLGTNALGYAVNNSDNVGVGIVWGPGPLGLYTRTYQLLQVPLQQINAPLTRVVLPVMSRAQNDQETYERFFRRFQLAVCYTLGLGFALLAGVADPLVGVLFGPSWTAAAPVLTALALSGVFKGIDSANYQLWVSRGLTAQLLKFYAWSRPLLIIVILAGLPWGPVGVACGQLVGAILHFVVGLRIVSSLAGIDARPVLAQTGRALAMVLAPACALSWGVVHLGLPDPLALVAGIAAGLAWSAAAVVLLPPVRRDVLPLWRTVRASSARLVP